VEGSNDICHVEVGHQVCREGKRQGGRRGGKGGRGAGRGRNVSSLGLWVATGLCLGTLYVNQLVFSWFACDLMP
jgi:hypothetical protein